MKKKLSVAVLTILAAQLAFTSLAQANEAREKLVSATAPAAEPVEQRRQTACEVRYRKLSFLACF